MGHVTAPRTVGPHDEDQNITHLRVYRVHMEDMHPEGCQTSRFTPLYYDSVLAASRLELVVTLQDCKLRDVNLKGLIYCNI